MSKPPCLSYESRLVCGVWRAYLSVPAAMALAPFLPGRNRRTGAPRATLSAEQVHCLLALGVSIQRVSGPELPALTRQGA